MSSFEQDMTQPRVLTNGYFYQAERNNDYLDWLESKGIIDCDDHARFNEQFEASKPHSIYDLEFANNTLKRK